MLTALTASCGGGSPPLPVEASSVTPPPAAPAATVSITPAGMRPSVLTVAIGTRVTFVNNDVIPHDIAGGPDPQNPDCHEIDAAGFLTPGQSRQTAPLPVARDCDYHDHSFHSALFTGRILVR